MEKIQSLRFQIQQLQQNPTQTQSLIRLAKVMNVVECFHDIKLWSKEF